MTKNLPYHSRSLFVRFCKKNKREKDIRRKKTGFYRYYFDVIKTAKSKGKTPSKDELPRYSACKINNCVVAPVPEYSDNIKFLAENPHAFDRASLLYPPNGVFKIPPCFSLTENYEASFALMKKLFYSLYKRKFKRITLDFIDCESIDIDASACMDILLGEFITYMNSCKKKNIYCKIKSINAINFQKDNLTKILFSIGAFTNIAGIKIDFPGIKPFPLIIGNNYSATRGKDKEVEVTKMVDYILECLEETGQQLTWEAESHLSKVIGEVLINSAEHSGRKFRYAIGYFEKKQNGEQNFGMFNLSIFSFGNTIYQNFKKPGAEDWHVVGRMKELSKDYTKKNFFLNREFEEETLWTLYALQEGVTSVKDRKRGNGSIHFIESFFSLKGDMENDNFSYLTIMSGNTRIKFDGSYKIITQQRGKDGKNYKMMTFNHSGNIEEKPDGKYVTFARNFFPGTLISAKICINFKNIEKKEPL